MDNKTIKSELESAIPRKIREVEMTDGKVEVSFCGSEPVEGGMYGYWEYDKIFDSWEKFSKYAQDFFKLT